MLTWPLSWLVTADHGALLCTLVQVLDTSSRLYIILELANDGDMFQYMKDRGGKLDERTARRFFRQTLSGVDYCHRRMVVHRDLKPENGLLDAHLNAKVRADSSRGRLRPARFAWC